MQGKHLTDPCWKAFNEGLNHQGTKMEFLGSQSAELRKMRGQIMALEVFLQAVVVMDARQLAVLRSSFDWHAEEARTALLNSMATDELCLRLNEYLESYSQSVRDRF